MLLEGAVLFLFLGLAFIASAVIALRAVAQLRGFQLEAARRPGLVLMSRTDITPVRGLSGEAEEDVSTDVKPLPWLHCALLILLTSALCYGLGYFVIAEFLYGRL